MNEDEILSDIGYYIRQMIRRAIADEREACARLVETMLPPNDDSDDAMNGPVEVAEAIRARL